MDTGHWKSRTGFVMAAVGSAVGLGNIWRFPYMAYENGGGAFLVPYLFALITAGAPLLIMEFCLGKGSGLPAPEALARLSRHWRCWYWCNIVNELRHFIIYSSYFLEAHTASDHYGHRVVY